MKNLKKYEKLQIDLCILETEDILTSSFDVDFDDGDNEDIWSDWL